MKTPSLVLAVTACLIAAPQTRVHAQGICAEAPGFRDFDFWVGEWDVYSNDTERRLLGTNSITRHHGDCLIKEDWTGVSGSAGFSINYFNNVTSEWRQVWVSRGYSIDYSGGLDDNGAMVLEGAIYDYAKKTETGFRGTWTPQPDGDVVQRFEIHDAETDAWNLWFEGLYVRTE